MVETVNERQVIKKRKIVLSSHITNIFGNHKPYAKSNPTQTYFLEELMLYIAIRIPSFVICGKSFVEVFNSSSM